MFGEEAGRAAQEGIQRVERQFGAEVLVETLDRVPAQCAGKLEQEGADRFFEKWAKKRAKRASAVYVLVVRQPATVKVELGTSAGGWRLGREQAAELEEMVDGAARKGNFDEGLADGVDYVHRTIARTWGAGESRQTGVGGGWVGLLLGAALSATGVWGIVRTSAAKSL
jgi:uncharacterized membrane protein YgcG